MLVTALPVEGVFLQKSLRSTKNQGLKGCRATSKSLKRTGSSARTRTWNSSVDELTAEPEALADPIPASTTLEFPLPPHRFPPGLKPFLIRQPPGPGVTLGVERATIIRVVVLAETPGQVPALPKINLSGGVRENVDPKCRGHVRCVGSSARTRTWNPSVNSCPPWVCDSLR